MQHWLALAAALSAWFAPGVDNPAPPADLPPTPLQEVTAPATSEDSAPAAVDDAAFADLLERHAAALAPCFSAFSEHTVVVDYTEDSGGLAKQISLTWQDGSFRQEYNWIGINEVFAYDGADHWYASDISLPYQLDSGQGVDVTPQLVGYFAYLAPELRQYLTPYPAALPFALERDYALMLFSPPAMSQAVLLIDPVNFELAGMLYGNYKEFDAAALFKLTRYQGWRDFGLCPYPELITTQTLSTTGEVLREKVQQTVALSAIAPVEPALFSRAAAPHPPTTALPTAEYEVPFSFLDDNVVVRARGPQGQLLRLEIDTGANVGLLRGDVVASLGLTPVGEEHITGHGGATIVQYARVAGVVLEGLNGDLRVELPPWPAAVIAGNERFDESLKEKDISGLLGNFILSNFVVKLDYRRRRMTLYDPQQFDPMVHLTPAAHALPVTRDSLPYVSVEVDDAIRGGAFFNTGAQQYFALSAWAADAAGIEYDIISLGTGMTVNGLTVFGLIEPEKIRLDGLLIDPAERTHLELLAPGEAPNPNRIASFGNAFFRHFVVTFDLFGGFYYIEEM